MVVPGYCDVQMPAFGTLRCRSGFRKLGLGIAAALLSLALPIAAALADDNPSIITLNVENDLFGGQDRHFTHGTRLSWSSPADDVPAFLRQVANAVPLFDDRGQKRITYLVGQTIFTPEDTQTASLVRDDRPYAGWLFGGAALTSDLGHRLDTLEVDIGVVGPASLAGYTQKRWHVLIDVDKPHGWRNQLHNEPGAVVYYDRKWRERFPLAMDFAIDAIPHVAGSVGNILTHVGAGSIVRLGRGLPSDYGPSSIRPGIPGSDFFVPSDRLGWYVFAGTSGRLVGRDIFLDGNTFQDSHSVEKNYLVGELQAGIVFTLGNVRLGYAHVLRTPEFKGQGSPDNYGAITLSVGF
jgi:lipid A 3-O-deacylase